MRQIAIFFLCISAVAAQQAPSADDQSRDNEVRPNPVTLSGQFFDHDFVNYFVFGNGIYDTRVPVLQSSQTSGGFGYEVGGGVTAAHRFRDGNFSISYRGDYRGYFNSGYNRGTDQSLLLSYDKRLGRRWVFSTSASGGILQYGGGFYSATPSPGNSVVANPFSAQTRFVYASVSFSYQQTRRLSYVFGGNFNLNNYNYAGALGSVGGSGSVSLLYRTTVRTTVGGTYSRTYYKYTQGAGQTTIDGYSLTVSHTFRDHWLATINAGVSRVHSSGTITVPLAALFGGQLVNGFVTGPYDRVSLTPSFQGSLTRGWRHASASVSAGQGILPGNGTFLTSRNQFLNGVYSYSTRRSNISFGGGYFRLESISNTVSQSYSSGTMTVSYGYTIRPHLAANLRYDYIHYGGLGTFTTINESRFSFGLSLSSKSIPLTLF